MSDDKDTAIPLKAWKLAPQEYRLPLVIVTATNGFAVRTPQGMAVFADLGALKRALCEAVDEFAVQSREWMTTTTSPTPEGSNGR